MQNGKGDKPRPLTVPKSEFDKNWDLVFGKKNAEKEQDKDDKPKSQ